MTKVYWQAHHMPKYLMLIMCLVSLCGLASVEHFKQMVPKKYNAEKQAAAALAYEAMSVIRSERIKRNIPIDLETDPQYSGLIGEVITPVTSDHGVLSAKRTSINPNMAALVVDWLKKIGVNKGDTIAIGFTGSFPALNIAVLSAVKTLELKPLIIASASSSQWGANIPGFLWLDMQQTLQDKGIFPYEPIAASIGGNGDNGKGMSEVGNELLRSTIQKYQLPFIDSENAVDGTNKRMAIFETKADNNSIKLFINTGGGIATVGKRINKKRTFKPGLNTSIPSGAGDNESVMMRFMEMGVPVINLTNMTVLAKEFGMPKDPVVIPAPGEGSLFYDEQYNPLLAASILAFIAICLFSILMLNKKKFYLENAIMEPVEV